MRKNSATKLQAQVRGIRVRQRVKRGKSKSNYVVQTKTSRRHHGTDKAGDIDDDPEIVAARERVRALKAEYRKHREDGNKGKLQMSLLDYDLAVQELNELEIRQMKRNKKPSSLAPCCLVACLPCMLAFQFFCCVSTASTGEYAKKKKNNAMMRDQLSHLASDTLKMYSKTKKKR